MNIICFLRQCWSGGAPYHPAKCCFNIRHFLWRGIDSRFGDLFQKLIFSVHNLLNLEKVTFFNDTYLSPCLNKLHIALRQYFKSANHKFVVFWNRSSRATNHLDPPFLPFPSPGRLKRRGRLISAGKFELSYSWSQRWPWFKWFYAINKYTKSVI